MVESELLIFIRKSKEINGDSFDYSKFEYTGSKNKSILICNSCKTEFLTTPTNNLQGNGCKKCNDLKRGREYVKNLLYKIHPNWKFNLDKYQNRKDDIEFFCENNHKSMGKLNHISNLEKCIICDKTERINNKIKIINYKSDSEIEYECKNCSDIFTKSLRTLLKEKECRSCKIISKSKLVNPEIKIIKLSGSIASCLCDKDHEYEQDIRNLLDGKGCRKCYENEVKISLEEIKNKIAEIHGDSYVYSDINLVKNIKSKISISCKKRHIFNQKLSNHLQGKGCPICKESFGERMISKILEDMKIKFDKQFKFKDCKFKNELKFDFFLPEMDCCIEYDGIQHFKPIDRFGGKEEFEKVKIKDKIKDGYCRKNNIHLIRINYLDNIEEKLKSSINELISLKS